MSNIADMGLDLDNLFQPAWAQGKTEANKFENFTGDEGVRPERRRTDRGDRPRGPRREGGGPGGFGGDRRGGERRGGEGRPPRAGGGGGRFGDRKGGPRRDDRRDDRRERPEPPAPLPELNVAFIPDEKGVEQIAKQIRMTGRAYPLFQIAQLILQKADRYTVQLTVKKKADDTVAQQIFVCALDDTPWVSEDEAVAHVLKNHFATFYQTDKIPCDPPKGVYTFVAQCGMSGVILGPPNYHDYQNQLRRLHTEKFSRMPFDMFKSRVKIVKDEAVVKKWIEEQSSKVEYTALNVPEPVKFGSMAEVEQHFRATHKDAIIKAVESHVVAGTPSRSLRSQGLQQLIRKEWEHQRYFPLPVATKLSQQFATHGLQFFKVNKTVTHVSVARPQYLDLETTPVSDGIRRIVEYINSNAKCTRKKLIEALAPTPKAAPAPAAPVAEAPTPAAPAAEGEAAAAPAPAPAPAKPAEPKTDEPTPEQTAVMVDLHWLIHQGAVLEFADGRMETAKKPAPKPPKPEKKEEKAETPAEGEAPAPATESQSETAVATDVEPAVETPVAATEVPPPAPEAEDSAAAAPAPETPASDAPANP
ncbi:MAG TPA: hypothetical protein VF988_16195 [Verrucomicrobiae bacterium]